MSATVLQFPTPQPNDGGKARILRRRKERALDDLALLHGPGIAAPLGIAAMCELTMGHTDLGMPSDSAYSAPASDPA